MKKKTDRFFFFFSSLPANHVFIEGEMCVLKYDGDWKYADAVFLLLQQMVFISFFRSPIFYMFLIVRSFFSSSPL
jgi:hypothetical protein